MAAGEGFETMASLRTVMPALPVAAATSANHLAGLTFPPGCRRLYIAADADAAGRHGIERLSRRAGEAGILALALRPRLGDYHVGDIEFSAAFDVDANKVGADLSVAIGAAPRMVLSSSLVS